MKLVHVFAHLPNQLKKQRNRSRRINLRHHSNLADHLLRDHEPTVTEDSTQVPFLPERSSRLARIRVTMRMLVRLPGWSRFA